jgi:putative nucleotidyltransferase with HDIG domain
MRLVLSVILVLITFFACYIEEIYLFVLPPQTKKVVPFTFRSQRHFNFDQEKALGGRREIALSRYVPLYTYVPHRVEEANKVMKALTERVFTLKDRKSSGEQDLLDYLHIEYALVVDPKVAAKLLLYQDLENLAAGILTIEESILQNKIVEDPEPLKGKMTIEILYPEPVGVVVHPAGEVITLDEARLALHEKVNQLFWQVDKEVLDPVLQISLLTLLPNLKYDHKENDRRIENIIRRYPSNVIPYKPGDILVPFRKVLGEEDVLLLAAYQDEGKKDLYGKAIWMLIAAVFMVVLYNLFLSKILWAEWRKKPPSLLLLSLLIITIILCKACLLLTAFPIYMVPFAVLPLLVILLHNERISATWTTVIGAMMVSLFFDHTLDILLFFTFGGVAAVLASFKIRNRIDILLPSAVVGIINAVILMALSMDWETVAVLSGKLQKIEISSVTEIFSKSLLENMGWAFMGGLAAGPMALLLLPLLEVSWHTASTFKLNKYADLQHPLMKDLLTKIPATYQHTMTVAYLARAAGQAIGADTSLLTIGAYYHDIGKMRDPRLFVENQSGRKNPHDDLDPLESAKLIINHVQYGEKIGREMRLPQVLLDLIRQHHGTHLVEYFYNKAIKASGRAGVRKQDFRYPGPRPQSVEAAILMIVDAVEAASRSLQKPTRSKIAKLIRLLVLKRVADGQFDECNLSTRYLAKIIRTLEDSLEASLHPRVAYPWQEKEKEGESRVEEKD